MKYKTILADPPWAETGGGRIHRGADRHYPLMSTSEIMWLPVQPLVDDNAHLYLWVTNNFLKDGIAVMEKWGFRYVTNIVWVKDRFGLGYYFRGQHELLLFGVKGTLKPNHKNFDKDYGEARWSGTENKEGVVTPTTVISAKRREHSKKPLEAYTLIETVSPGPYLELFCREPREGWAVWGNEVESEVKL